MKSYKLVDQKGSAKIRVNPFDPTFQVIAPVHPTLASPYNMSLARAGPIINPFGSLSNPLSAINHIGFNAGILNPASIFPSFTINSKTEVTRITGGDLWVFENDTLKYSNKTDKKEFKNASIIVVSGNKVLFVKQAVKSDEKESENKSEDKLPTCPINSSHFEGSKTLFNAANECIKKLTGDKIDLSKSPVIKYYDEGSTRYFIINVVNEITFDKVEFKVVPNNLSKIINTIDSKINL